MRGCQSVTYNTFLPTGQGEIDVIGVRLGHAVEVHAAEVAIHLDSLQYGTYAVTVDRVSTKMLSARTYLDRLYPQAQRSMEFWSPVVPKGLVSAIGERGAEHGFTLVANQDFTDRVDQLLVSAGKHTKMTGEPAYRMLQILTHLRGHEDLHL